VSAGGHKLALTVDVEESYHSGRWVDERPARALPGGAAPRDSQDSGGPNGVAALTRRLLDLFERRAMRATFFVLGDVARRRPGLVAEIAARGHEIACHGQDHVDMTVLGPARFAAELERSARRLCAITGQRPIGYRAPNLVYEPWATRILEDHGFRYDSSVCPSRPMGGKYHGWAKAPSHPYRPSYDDVAALGGARLVELPLPAFPLIKLAAGSGITTRILGLQWTLIALRAALRRGDSVYYLHPWELGAAPAREGHWLRRTVFHANVGRWMAGALEHILDAFAGRLVTAAEAAASCTAPDWAYRLAPLRAAQPA
jgi:peptidoglycan/xylan/chitin deacetylase (PgdA/CDA1 family)